VQPLPDVFPVPPL